MNPFLFYSVGHQTHAPPSEAQGVQRLGKHNVPPPDTGLPAPPSLLFSPGDVCRAKGLGFPPLSPSWEPAAWLCCEGRRGQRGTPIHRTISGDWGGAEGDNTQQGHWGYLAPLHLDVVSQLHRAVLSLLSQVDAVQVLGENRSAQQRSSPLQGLHTHKQINPMRESRTKTNTEFLAQLPTEVQPPAMTPPGPCQHCPLTDGL